ncbi:MAG TPA: DUF4148 domain-containing protein [Ramlibacter sp.]|jgi:hypothetical protein|nr:DUF4148 domain-containing protein [Ramlibacter sp.]
MNRTITLSALVLAAGFAGQAFAESPLQGSNAFDSGRTRAEVQAELATFKKGPNPWSTSYNPLRSFRSSTSRDAVTAAYVASRDEVKALNGEDSGSAWLTASRAIALPTTLAGEPQNAR